jgi:hypothetical protein
MTYGHTLTEMLRQQWLLMRSMVDTEYRRSGDLPKSALRVLRDRVNQKLEEFDQELAE